MPRPSAVKPPAHPDLGLENSLWSAGLALVAGLDEAGRGAWAGPVFAAAVILPQDDGLLVRLNGVRDSKQMTARQRRLWAGQIQAAGQAWGIGQADSQEVDRMGIVPATRLAMERALQACGCQAEHLLIDALKLPQVDLPQSAIIKGDARSLSIAAASVLAKTARDALMEQFDQEFPGYGFGRHKGYGTAAHRVALERLGACTLHRMSFGPLRRLSQDPG